MASPSPPRKGRAVPETFVQETILEQAQAAAAAQSDLVTPTRQEATFEATDLITPNGAEDNIPPPTYGEIYGEVQTEKNGLGTSARITDDGRVNIRINQLNRRLSQIFTPALRQQVASVQDSGPPPSPYILPSSRDEEGAPLPPPLNIVMQVVGSRGDVQPFVALGKVLKDIYGHRVRLATHPNFKDFVQENGLEFFSIGGDPSRLMASMVKNPSLMPGFRSLLSGDVDQRRRDVAEYIQGCWRSCYKAGDGMNFRAINDDLSKLSRNDPNSEHMARPFVADCIIANPPSFAHIHCAEKLGIPLHIMFTMPYSPTQAFPHPLANVQSSNADPQLTNYLSYAMIEVLSWQGLGDIINRFRAKCLGLDPVSLIWAPGMLQQLKIPHTYCWSPALIPKPKDWGPHISISGFSFLDMATEYTAAPALQAFIDAGPTPVYIGFGSIVLDNPDTMTELIFEAVRKSGQRLLLSKGWGGLGTNLRIPDGVFILDNVPHDWLFKQVSCVVHHGGAGTTAAGLRAGRPTLVVPFFGDQPFWGATVARAGAGPTPIPYKRLTADKLADAINFCLKPETLERAKGLASKMAAEKGSDVAAQSLHQHLEVDRLRCTLAPSRSAAWRIKRTRVRLSAFAACTLANAGLLDFHDLKLFRPQEYNTDEGPWDPVSGFATALFGAFSSMVMGVADLPSETLKALHVPIGSSRQQSQESMPTIVREDMTSHLGGRSTPSTSPDQSRTSLNVKESLSRVRSPSNDSGLSPHTSDIGSSSLSDGLQGQSSPKQDFSSTKDRDMLRQTIPHTSKGFGRIVKAAVQSPMEMTMGITKGFHNVPKLWGDDIVRPQERVRDLKTGAIAIGREFGFGWYDGVTGLFTQPWKGAQKEGTSGFFKGIGKGVGGFVTKPGAALFGIPGHFMKGVHKEVQKLYGSNVQNYIIASRTAQGYEEWLQSSDAEKQDVIDCWKMVQKFLKEKRKPDEMLRDVLEAQRKMKSDDGEARQNSEHTANYAQSASTHAPTLDLENTVLATGGPQSPGESLGAAEINETFELSVPETPRSQTKENASAERTIQGNMSQLQRSRQKAAGHQSDQENLRRAIAASEAEAQRHVTETSREKRRLKRAMAQSLREQTPSGQQRSSRGPGHLAGTTQTEFEAQRQEQEGEKTTQERTEEEIVMEYMRKQSLLEMQHQSKGKSRATAIEDDDDEDLQKALKLSTHGDGNDLEVQHGQASGM